MQHTGSTSTTHCLHHAPVTDIHEAMARLKTAAAQVQYTAETQSNRRRTLTQYTVGFVLLFTTLLTLHHTHPSLIPSPLAQPMSSLLSRFSMSARSAYSVAMVTGKQCNRFQVTDWHALFTDWLTIAHAIFITQVVFFSHVCGHHCLRCLRQCRIVKWARHCRKAWFPHSLRPV